MNRTSRMTQRIPVLLAALLFLVPVSLTASGGALAAPARPALTLASPVLGGAASHPVVLPSHPSRSVLAPPPLGRGAHVPPSWTPGAPPVLPSVNGIARPLERPSAGSNSFLSQNCYGIWPGGWGNQSTYEGNCYGHDEPGLDPYSNLPGSGGNVTWQVRLPVDGGSPTVQADLYAAIWFGLVLTAPGAWLNECFLELQLYPDQSWTGGYAPNTWDAAAVAWQIDVTNGYEDACFYQPLGDDATGNYLVMHGGDRLNVALSGYPTSTAGEQIELTDSTQGNRSTTSLYDFQYNTPLDPAYTTDSFQNALQWTPGGELPVSFAFETGHTISPYPNNNSYGGCSAGLPPPTLQDPATPCPSYDPGFWANGTQAPWQIAPPVFFNAKTRSGTSQVDFSQDFGGIRFIDEISNGSCDGRDGSAFCSYPWYSYSCASHAFNFGAMVYPGDAAEFGATEEYNASFVQDLEGNGFYSTTNVSVPTCGEPLAHVTLGATGNNGGIVRLLGQSAFGWSLPHGYDSADLSPGNYSVDAVPLDGVRRAGGYFNYWNATGGVTVSDPTNPWTSVQVSGNGGLQGVFNSTPPLVQLKVSARGPVGYTGPLASLLPDFVGPQAPARTLYNGSSADLAPGIYSLQAYPLAGYNFTSWTIAGGSVLAAPTLPYTWLVISRQAGNVSTLTLAESASPALATVALNLHGTAGAVDFGGTEYSASTNLTFPVGTYPVIARPAPGSRWVTSDDYGDSMLLDLEAATNLTLQEGATEFDVYFEENISVLLQTSGGSGTYSGDPGQISWGLPNRLVGNNTRLFPHQVAPSRYTVDAVPWTGERFTDWTVSNGSAAWIGNSTQALTSVLLNASVSLVAHFTSGSGVGILLDDSPAGGGGIGFNFSSFPSFVFGAGDYPNDTWFNGSTIGEYIVEPIAANGYAFAGWSTGGALAVGSAPGWSGFYAMNVSTGGGTLTAHFTRLPTPRYAVTFVSSPANSFAATVNGTLLGTGFTAYLPPGNYTLVASALGAATFGAWSGTIGLSPVSPTNQSSVLRVTGSGTIYAMATGPVEARAAATPVDGAAPLAVRFTGLILNGSSPFASAWNFGDGTPVTPTLDANHAYAAPGKYTASLEVSDAAGNSSFWISIGVTGVAPGLQASLSTLVGDAPLPVLFASNASGGTPPYQVRWSFGDGASSSAWNGTHTYLTAGTEAVSVKLTDSRNVSVTDHWTVTVNSPPSAQLMANVTAGPAPLAVQFTTVASGGTGAYTYAWSFGDGTSAGNLSGVAHVFTTPGNFTVNLLVSDAAGGSAGPSILVVVGAPIGPLLVSLSTTPGKVEIGQTTVLEAVASGGVGPYRYSWLNLPSGCSANSSANANLSCTPESLGYYNVTVQVTDSRNHAASTVAELLVTPVPSTSKPTPSPPAPAASNLGLLEAVIAVLLIAAVLALVLLYRSKRRAGPATEPARAAEPKS
jgi:PKD repeat protein